MKKRNSVNRALMIVTIPAILAIAGVIGGFRPVSAEHESTNALAFAAPAGSGDASGVGTVTFHGGDVDTSRWTAQFAFSGLAPGQRYVVVVEGRFGEDGSPEARAFTSLCSFEADASGAGGCWWYHKELRRLGIVQLRSGDEAGAVVLQATRDPGGPGSITSVPNVFSPTATPNASPEPATPIVTDPMPSADQRDA